MESERCQTYLNHTGLNTNQQKIFEQEIGPDVPKTVSHARKEIQKGEPQFYRMLGSSAILILFK